MIVRQVQAEEFIEDIKMLKLGNKVRKGSKLVALLPYFDDKSILRIGGRLKHAVLPEETSDYTSIPPLRY